MLKGVVILVILAVILAVLTAFLDFTMMVVMENLHALQLRNTIAIDALLVNIQLEQQPGAVNVYQGNFPPRLPRAAQIAHPGSLRTLMKLPMIAHNVPLVNFQLEQQPVVVNVYQANFPQILPGLAQIAHPGSFRTLMKLPTSVPIATPALLLYRARSFVILIPPASLQINLEEIQHRKY